MTFTGYRLFATEDEAREYRATLVTEATLVADQRRKLAAAEQRARAEESFQRCDTDGFFSQWSSQIGAQMNDTRAEIDLHEGTSIFPVVVDIASEKIVSTKIFEFVDRYRGFGKQGVSKRVAILADGTKKWFGAYVRPNYLAKMGLRYGYIVAPAIVSIGRTDAYRSELPEPRGMGGATSVGIRVTIDWEKAGLPV